MKIIKSFFVLLMLTGVATFSPGNGYSQKAATKLEKTFPVGKYGVNISFPKKWKVVPDMGPFDLQCTDGNSYASVFVFYVVDLAKGQTPLDLFYKQNDDIFSKRLNVEVIHEKETEINDDQVIHSMLYSAEKNNAKNYYYCNLVEFGNNSDKFVWILFTALPSYALDNIADWKKIVGSTSVK